MRTSDINEGYLDWVGDNSTEPVGFMTNRPKKVWVTKKVTDYLCWHNHWRNGAVDTVVKAEVFYVNNTSVADVLATIDNTTRPKHEVWGIAAGFDELGLDSFSPGSGVVKYRIYLEHADSDHVIEQWFYLLPETDMGCSVIYRNAYGVPEGMWCEGERVTEVEHSRELIDVGRGNAPTALTLKERSYGRTVKPRIAVTSAPLLRTEWIAPMDMLLSDKVYVHFVGGAGKMVAAQLEPGSVEESTVNWEGNNMAQISMRLVLNEEVGWSVVNGNV